MLRIAGNLECEPAASVCPPRALPFIRSSPERAGVITGIGNEWSTELS